MELDPQEAVIAIQTGMTQINALLVSYSFSVIGGVVLLVAGYFAAGLAERSLAAGLSRIHSFDPTLCRFFSKLARYVILALVGVMVLGQFGVQTASIIATVGAIGLAIGLALQGTLQNIAAGIMLLALRPFRIGEDVEIGAIAGTIEEIGFFATRLRTADGIFILAPNSTLWNQPVRNFSRNGIRRTDLTIRIGYDDDIDKAQKTLVDLAASDKRVRKEPAPAALVTELGDDRLSITLRYWASPADFLATKLDLTKRVKLTFDEEPIRSSSTKSPAET
jgi:small conductance mechanosensitive channel